MMTFHHIGVACADLDRETAAFALLGYAPEGGVIEDPVQGVRLRFLAGGGPRMELVAPLDDRSSVLAGVLKQRIKLYHTAYLAKDLPAAIDRLRAERGKLVVPSSPAVAFEGRDIAFLAMPNGLLVELIQAP